MVDLTSRELEVLKLICQGCSTKQISSQLGVAFKTAACPRSRILDKAGASNAVGLLLWAIRKGIISIDQQGVVTQAAQATEDHAAGSTSISRPSISQATILPAAFIISPFV